MFYFTGGKTPSDSLKYNTGKKKVWLLGLKYSKHAISNHHHFLPFAPVKIRFMTEAKAEHTPQGDEEMFKGSLGH